MKDTTFTLRMDTATLEILKSSAKKNKMTNSEYIRFLIRLADIIKFMPSKVYNIERIVESEVTDIDEAY